MVVFDSQNPYLISRLVHEEDVAAAAMLPDKCPPCQAQTTVHHPLRNAKHLQVLVGRVAVTPQNNHPVHSPQAPPMPQAFTQIASGTSSMSLQPLMLLPLVLAVEQARSNRPEGPLAKDLVETAAAAINGSRA
jgi:hypothetical protein